MYLLHLAKQLRYFLFLANFRRTSWNISHVTLQSNFCAKFSAPAFVAFFLTGFSFPWRLDELSPVRLAGRPWHFSHVSLALLGELQFRAMRNTSPIGLYISFPTDLVDWEVEKKIYILSHETRVLQVWKNLLESWLKVSSDISSGCPYHMNLTMTSPDTNSDQ